MTRGRWRWVETAVAAGLAVAGSTSCSRHAVADAGAAPVQPVATRAAEPSLYDLDVPLVESDGRRLALSNLRGRTVVAAMMYTSCTTVCPRITEDMKALERRIPAGERGGVTFVMFSLDAGRDTPEALRRFAADHRLDRGWRLFAAAPDAIRTLAAALGVKFAREPSGTIAHSAAIFLIDPGGVVRHRQVGLSTSPDGLLQALAATGSER